VNVAVANRDVTVAVANRDVNVAVANRHVNDCRSGPARWMMKTLIDKTRCVMTVVLLVALGELAVAADPPKPAKPPVADEVMTEIGLSDDEKKKVLAGEYVTSEVAPVSERDLSVGITFLVKGTTPDALAKEIASGAILSSDPQVKKSGPFRGKGGLVDVSRIRLDPPMAMKLSRAKAGTGLNLSTAEIASFASTGTPGAASASQALQNMLVARFQAYRASGLGGIAPYDRGGSTSDVAGDLRKASESLSRLKKYLPALEGVLVSYPQGLIAGMAETFHWVDYDLDGTRTFVLTHGIVAPMGDARAVVQRQFYVSTGYNAEQAVAVFLPVAEGTVVIYRNHTFTEQVAGFGGSAKKSIGRGIMTKKLEAMFDKTKAAVAAP
jgi:hypothetical protein